MSSKRTGIRVELARWMIRTTDWARHHPQQAFGLGASMVVFAVVYDAMVTHKGRVPSPLLANHLEYEMKTEGMLPKLSAKGLQLRDTPEMAKEKVQSTLYVNGSQLDERSPHWEVRVNEQNWSVMARDLQKQKDEYWYRAERSKDDDFGRRAAVNKEIAK
jgi:hypothetical protein